MRRLELAVTFRCYDRIENLAALVLGRKIKTNLYSKAARESGGRNFNNLRPYSRAYRHQTVFFFDKLY